jgi:hypothetical protein
MSAHDAGGPGAPDAPERASVDAGSDAIDITVSPAGSPPPAGRLHGEGGISAVPGTYPSHPRVAGRIDFAFSVRQREGNRVKSSVRVHLKGVHRMLKSDHVSSVTIIILVKPVIIINIDGANASTVRSSKTCILEVTSSGLFEDSRSIPILGSETESGSA